MKSWGVLFVTSIGFLLGMVLAGVGGLSAKTTFFSETDINQQKRIEHYWSETGIGEKELFELISNSNCQSSEKYFLSCVNSIVQSADGFQLQLSPETGLLEDFKPGTNSLDLSEKENLLPYMQMYARQANHTIDFEQIWTELLAKEAEEKKPLLIASGINSFLSIFKDPHTYILPNNYYEEVGSQLERANTFVGVAFERFKQQIRVRKVFRNSDAEKAGLKPQDILLSIDQEPAQSLTLQKISQLLKIPERKKFVLKVKRQGESKEIAIERSFRNLNHVQFDVIEGQRTYAIITVTKFNRGVCKEVSTQIKNASERNITGLVLDLRDNPGGQLDEAACLAGLFIGMNKKVYSVEYFDPVKSNEVVLTSGSLLYTGPMIVLMNSASASASELFAGAMQEYKRAILIGEKTFGKGTFQESEIWTKNNRITLFRTQGFYLLPSNDSTQIIGVSPDIEVVEPHVQIREENLYLNPIPNSKTLQSGSKQQNIFEEQLKKCSKDKKEFQFDDLVLQKAIDVLACRSITSTIATQFNVEEFN